MCVISSVLNQFALESDTFVEKIAFPGSLQLTTVKVLEVFRLTTSSLRKLFSPSTKPSLISSELFFGVKLIDSQMKTDKLLSDPDFIKSYAFFHPSSFEKMFCET